ncbi:MAG: aminotransferase class I/II-fold pyridoxal phosphate-dependent enzyme, partial [Planctomycetaceae bacterium]|nr:aminotransferase class I/II-fold pyridoxal phosphate-dependent enzyme [Planctomycetaceae bacterium]
MTAERIRNRLNAELQRLKHLQLFRQHRVTESLPDGRCRVDERTLINFGSNDYLNLAHEVMQSEHIRELASQGLGATGSELLTGHSEWHEQLEHALAEFEGTEAAVLFPSGFSANIGVLQSLVTSADAVFCDRDNHASLIDGARCSDGEFFVFRGDRPEVLERSLARRRSQFDQVLIVTDGVFSMDGRVADLNALCDIAERHDALVIVDEAHGTGVLGANGRGATEVCGVEHRVFLRIGTLSKALGGLGGFAVSDHITIDWLRNSARSRFFSTALPPLICAAMLESLRVVDEQPERRARLRELTDFANSEIRRLGLNSV